MLRQLMRHIVTPEYSQDHSLNKPSGKISYFSFYDLHGFKLKSYCREAASIFRIPTIGSNLLLFHPTNFISL